MIETKNVIKVIGEKLILRGVNIHIKCGETVAILGPNGAGKSTWLKIVAGLVKETEGNVFIAGKQLKKDEYESREMIGYLGHLSFLYDHLTPVENLLFFAKLYDVKKPHEKIKELLDIVGLTFYRNEPVRSFSRGMLQRLAIARAILHDPKILLLDEPHTGLDQHAVQILNDVILRLKKAGVTTVIVTHDFPQVIATCDRAIILKDGRVKEDITFSGQSVQWLHELYERQAMDKCGNG